MYNCTTSTTDLFQCLPILTVNKVLLMFKQYFLYFSLCTTEKSLAPHSLLPPIKHQAQHNSYSRSVLCLLVEFTTM